jgi:ABC-2 type transport system ATP-binding protein
MPKEILNITNLDLEIKNKLILDKINLKLHEKEILGLIGTSGSGKSMLLKTIAGLFKPKKGKITSGQQNLIKNKKPLKNFIGFSTQEASIYENLTVKENIYYFGRLYGIKRDIIKNRSKELIALLELEQYKNILAKKLSGGTVKRLNIACSLIHEPKILLLDEPISGLDPKLRENILSLIDKIRKKGTSIIITSHFINEIEPFCNRVGIISKGKILAMDSAVRLREAYSNTYEISIRSYPGKYTKLYRAAKTTLDVKAAFMKNNELIMHVPKNRTINTYIKYITKLLENNKEYTIKINVSQSPLNEVFRAITKNVT